MPLISDIADDIKEKISQINVRKIGSIADIEEAAKGLVTPALYIIYDGMSATQEGTMPIETQVPEINFTILSVTKSLKDTESAQIEAYNILDSVREKLIGKDSPTGFSYLFVSEDLVSIEAGTVIYGSKYSTKKIIREV